MNHIANNWLCCNVENWKWILVHLCKIFCIFIISLIVASPLYSSLQILHLVEFCHNLYSSKWQIFWLSLYYGQCITFLSEWSFAWSFARYVAQCATANGMKHMLIHTRPLNVTQTWMWKSMANWKMMRQHCELFEFAFIIQGRKAYQHFQLNRIFMYEYKIGIISGIGHDYINCYTCYRFRLLVCNQ